VLVLVIGVSAVETCMVAAGEGWESLTLAARRQPNI
jgi:hypothetical protein